MMLVKINAWKHKTRSTYMDKLEHIIYIIFEVDANKVANVVNSERKKNFYFGVIIDECKKLL